jgi:hypothetical protein
MLWECGSQLMLAECGQRCMLGENVSNKEHP